jgi:hypothetical protein
MVLSCWACGDLYGLNTRAFPLENQAIPACAGFIARQKEPVFIPE